MSLTSGQRANLKTEVQTDPLARGYSTMLSIEILISLNTVNRTRDRVEIPTWEILEAIDPTEYSNLTGEDKRTIEAVLSLGTINVQEPNTRSILAGIFTNATFPLSRANLIALQTEPISRLQQIGIFGTVTEHQINRARL